VDKDVLIVDDIIDTGGSLIKAAQVFKDRGARSIWAFATHGLFSEGAVDAIEKSVIERVVVTDTFEANTQVKKCKWSVWAANR